MFGVVLWSDEQDQKAVIWCEDHGDLAFYRNSADSCKVEMDAGDWVQFDMTMEQHQRFAHNPRLVSEGVFPDLADALCAAPVQENGVRNPVRDCVDAPSSDRKSAQIIPFLPAKSVRKKAASEGLAQLAGGAGLMGR